VVARAQPERCATADLIGAHLLQVEIRRSALCRRRRPGDRADRPGHDCKTRIGGRIAAPASIRCSMRRRPMIRRSSRALVLLCYPRRGRCRRAGTVLSNPRFRGRRGLRHDCQPDDCRRPYQRCQSASHRQRPISRTTVRLAGRRLFRHFAGLPLLPVLPKFRRSRSAISTTPQPPLPLPIWYERHGEGGRCAPRRDR